MNLVAVGSLLWTIFLLWWAWQMSQTYGLAPADGGALRSPGERYLLGAVIALVGVLPTVGLLLYRTRYLIRIERGHEVVTMTTLGLLAPRRHQVLLGDFRSISWRAPGRGRSWVALRVTGRALPYIADLGAERVDSEGLADLIDDAEHARGE